MLHVARTPRRDGCCPKLWGVWMTWFCSWTYFCGFVLQTHACIVESAPICPERWCPWGQHFTKRDLQEWHFASSCYWCDVGRGRVKAGEGGFWMGLVQEWCDITSRYILCCRKQRLVLPYQCGAKGLGSSEAVTSPLPLSPDFLFNMQTHLFCQAMDSNQFPAPCSAQNTGSIQ